MDVALFYERVPMPEYETSKWTNTSSLTNLLEDTGKVWFFYVKLVIQRALTKMWKTFENVVFRKIRFVFVFSLSELYMKNTNMGETL